MYKSECQHCGNEFESHKPTAKYCSPQCKSKEAYSKKLNKRAMENEPKTQAMQPMAEAGNFLQFYVHDLQNKVAKYEASSERYKESYEQERAKRMEAENKLHLKDQEMALALRSKEVEDMKGLGAIVDYAKSQEGTQLLIELVKIMKGGSSDISEDVKEFAEWYGSLEDAEVKLVDELLQTIAKSNISVVVPQILKLFIRKNQDNHAPKTQYQEAV